uniref:Pentatricopeptide repeat-containing protein n=1 Tax=Tanacetum cinerariifolium TaxID=118510 RepID=A0A6L2NE39_TANCI|nr:pentatricopeptide repeat-containing protein [Tanacetum cinerariifolium]
MYERPKNRIRAPNERKFPNIVSRAGVEMTCHNCLQKRHNMSSSTNLIVLIPPKEPTQKGRPKKNKGNASVGLEENVREGSTGSFRGGAVRGGVVRGGSLRGGTVRGGLVRGGRGRNVRGGVSRGGSVTGSRLIDETYSLQTITCEAQQTVNHDANVDIPQIVGGVDTVRGETIRGAISDGLSNLGVKSQILEAKSETSKTGKTLGIRIKRAIGKRQVVFGITRYARMGRWFGINENNVASDPVKYHKEMRQLLNKHMLLQQMLYI